VTVPAGTRVSGAQHRRQRAADGVRGEVSADTISGDLDIQGAANIDSVRTMSGRITVTGAQSDGTIDVGYS
jgi:hypothetical protein